MAAKRDAPELWEQQEGEKSQHYQKFCQYRDMPYGTQGREPEKRSIRRLADAMGMKSKSSIEKLSTQWNWVERAAAYDVYMNASRMSRKSRKCTIYMQNWACSF